MSHRIPVRKIHQCPGLQYADQRHKLLIDLLDGNFPLGPRRRDADGDVCVHHGFCDRLTALILNGYRNLCGGAVRGDDKTHRGNAGGAQEMEVFVQDGNHEKWYVEKQVLDYLVTISRFIGAKMRKSSFFAPSETSARFNVPRRISTIV